MMKRFLLATSILALTAGGVLAQGMTPGGMAPPTPGATTPGTAVPAPGAPAPITPGASSGAATGAMNGATAAAPLHHAASTVKEAQTALKEQGLYQGHVDGKIGPATKAAIAKFQKRKGLQQTAKLDSRTMNELLSGGGSSGGAGDSGGAMGGSTGTMGGGGTR
jgi:peptidoglycan hydrolase-like protein with peptidoglycan-binding domain